MTEANRSTPEDQATPGPDHPFMRHDQRGVMPRLIDAALLWRWAAEAAGAPLDRAAFIDECEAAWELAPEVDRG